MPSILHHSRFVGLLRLTLLFAVPVAGATAFSPFVREVVSTNAFPHMHLKSAYPAADTTLNTAPDAVRLWFSEPADAATARIDVKDAGGAAVATTKPVRGAGKDDPLVVKFSTTPGNGHYTVEWRAMSKDGHVVSGKYGFTVRIAK